MLTVRLPLDLENSLAELSDKLETNKSKMVIEALRQYIEDKKDYINASKVYNLKNEQYSHEEMLSELGL